MLAEQTDHERVKKSLDPEANYINSQLAKNYGFSDNGRQIFRVVWSENVSETRESEFDCFAGDIYIGTSRSVRRTKKYSYLNDKWILEKLVYNPTHEIKGSEFGNYEPIYVFQDGKGNFLPLNRRVVEIILDSLLNGSPWKKSDWESWDSKRREREEELFFSIIDNESNPFLSALHAGETVLNALDSSVVSGASEEKGNPVKES